jgi:hypothetical protein
VVDKSVNRLSHKGKGKRNRSAAGEVEMVFMEKIDVDQCEGFEGIHKALFCRSNRIVWQELKYGKFLENKAIVYC